MRLHMNSIPLQGQKQQAPSSREASVFPEISTGKGLDRIWSRNRFLLVFLIVLTGIMTVGLFRDPVTMHLPHMLAPPSPDMPFGTDHLGRDIFARLAHGMIWDLSLCISIVACSAVIGITLGLISGYMGSWIDNLVILLMDVLMSLPHIVLAMVIMMYLTCGPSALVISLAVTGWVKYCRIIRGQTYSVREQDYIICERVLGAGPFFIIFRHILPNVLPSIIGLAALHLGHTMLSIASLGFLGLGLQPPTPEWGTMIMESRPYIMRAPWTALFPGLFIFIFIAVFTIAGRQLDHQFTTAGDDHAGNR